FMAEKERCALVTGAASGIGRAVVERLLVAGTRVCAVDVRPIPLEHERLVCAEVDVTDAAQVDACYERVVEAFGGLDILVSSAGIGVHERLDEGDPEHWRRVIETNLMGAMRMIRAFAPLLSEGEGIADAIIVSSVADTKPYTYGGAYTASKAGLSAVAETLRLELQPRVRVTNVRPGMVDTAFFEHSIDRAAPTPAEVGWRPVPPAEVAEAVEFVLARPAGVAVHELVIRPVEQTF
ncbi:MAG: SDR family oxidoreductase, partial [Persicimonas sp.]